MTARWIVVVPFLRLTEGASRLGKDTARVVHAVGLDTVAAIARSEAVKQVIVVADSDAYAAEIEAMGPHLSVLIVPPAGDEESANAAVAAAATGHSRNVAVVRATLATLDPTQLTALLDAAADVPIGVVLNEQSTKTTVLTAREPADVAALITANASHLASGTAATMLPAGSTLRRELTSAQSLTQSLDCATLGARTREITRGWHVVPRISPTSDRRYLPDPPPARD